MTTDSIITRCPKCSTAFRVTNDVLKMANGKVRCGQCFHIFVATPAPQVPAPAPAPAPSVSEKPARSSQPNTESTQSTVNTSKAFPATEEPPVDPKWLNTLFDEDDLAPLPAKSKAQQTLPDEETPAPWEKELAELESALEQDRRKPQINTPSPVTPASVAAQQHKPSFPAPQQTNVQAPLNTQTSLNDDVEPDYMMALHALAQDISDQQHFTASARKAQDTLEQINAQSSLAPLVDDDLPQSKTRHGGLWLAGSFAALLLLLAQAGYFYFDSGSRSAQLRPIYKLACTYLGCVLPTFEDVTAINIQHTRIQSHPTTSNALVVNAIMNNTSQFAQPMPKIALEFYDLNGAPVAARLFTPNNYLHKDFLDITYMPPNTPIHIVISIHDPGARAVTHQLKVYSAQARSY